MMNPVKSIASTYKHLNRKRMEGLTKAKGTPKKKIWNPGQYCLLNHSPTGIIGEARDKIGVPLQPRVYKILSSDKDNFSYKVMDLQSGSIRQVNHSLLEELDLDKLMEISYYSPNLYDAVVVLTNRSRNRFIPGRRGADLTLVDPHTDHHNLEDKAVSREVQDNSDSGTNLTGESVALTDFYGDNVPEPEHESSGDLDQPHEEVLD